MFAGRQRNQPTPTANMTSGPHGMAATFKSWQWSTSVWVHPVRSRWAWLTWFGSWFWGKQAIAPSPRIRIHVPIAADMTATSADLLFAEAPEFIISDEDANEKNTGPA